MSGFTKLFGSILQSTVWREDLPTKVVWITMLALADRDGIVEASIPGLAHLAGVGVDETETALAKFMTSDKYSRSSEHSGRRIESVDGGWRLLNYDKYRQKFSAEDVRERNRIRQQRHREHRRPESDDDGNSGGADCDTSVTGSDKRHLSPESRHSRGRSRGREERNTGAGSDIRSQEEVTAMLDAFASVGARSFDVTITDLADEKVAGQYRSNRSLEKLRHTIGGTLQQAVRDRHNIIIRPRSTAVTLIQLDDLDGEKAQRIAPQALMVIRTSPGNHQVWIAVEDATPEFSGRLRKGIGADPTASGATRISGSLNFKTEYAPSFPMVEIAHMNSGNVTSVAALRQGGFVAALEQPRPRQLETNRVSAIGRRSRKAWPSYQLFVQGAPPIHQGHRPDISRVDFSGAGLPSNGDGASRKRPSD